MSSRANKMIADHPKMYAAYPLVEITWVDACGRTGWVNPPAEGPHPLFCLSTGYLVHSDANGATVALSHGCNGMVGDTLTIPKGMLLKVDCLREAVVHDEVVQPETSHDDCDVG